MARATSSLSKVCWPLAVPACTRTVVTISAKRIPTPGYSSERGLPGAIARLLAEDPAEMTAAANASPNHVGNDDRWTRKAQEANPKLNDDQANRVGQLMKKQHYVRMGKLSAQARQLARDAAAEMDAAAS